VHGQCSRPKNIELAGDDLYSFTVIAIRHAISANRCNRWLDGYRNASPGGGGAADRAAGGGRDRHRLTSRASRVRDVQCVGST
jgi:hypothetical protein